MFMNKIQSTYSLKPLKQEPSRQQHSLKSHQSFSKNGFCENLKGKTLSPLLFTGNISFGAVRIPRNSIPPPTGVFWDDNFAEVAPDIYRGAKAKRKSIPEMVKFLKSAGIKTVINFGDQNSEYTQKLQAAGITYIPLPMNFEHDPDQATIDRFLEVLRDKNTHPVYIHCNMGIERTGLMTALYRVEECGYSFKRAYEEMIDYGYSFRHCNNNLFGEFLLKYCINRSGDTGQRKEMETIHQQKRRLVEARDKEQIFAYFHPWNLKGRPSF